MKKGFTLVELLVVIGILGILTAVLVGTFAGGTDSARAVKCLSNMKNLASACQTYGMAHGCYPLAGSVEMVKVDESRGIRNIKMKYYELPGWLSWNSQGAYAGDVNSHVASVGWFTSAYAEETEDREFAYTNGVLWKYISGNRNLFQCPAHVKKFSGTPPAWSYFMNGYFGWDSSRGASAKAETFHGIGYSSLKRADRRLLLAEMPFMGLGVSTEPNASAGTDFDCVLQYELGTDAETVGFNHSSGKRAKFAHVVFADGHTEKLAWPKTGLEATRIKDLTKWLCQGKDISFNGQVYEELK